MFTKNIFTQTDPVADLIKGINETDYENKRSALTAANLFRVVEGWDDMLKDVKDKAGPQPSGGSGVKQGSSYGGSKQKDKPEQEVDKKKKMKKEEIDPKDTETDTLKGREKTSKNPFLSKKVMMDVPGNVKEELDEASFDPLKHVKNPSPAVKTAAKDVKRGSYADRAALMKAGGVKDDRGPRGVTQEEVEQQDEAVEKKTDFMDRQKRLAAASAETQKDPARLKRMSGIPGYTAAMDLAKKTTTKEEVEQVDEGKMDKSSLSSLWHKHAQHSYFADQGYGIGSVSMNHNSAAATAIENHVRKHHGNKVADDMVDHSEHHVSHAEYAGPKDSEYHEKEMSKLRKKHKIDDPSLHEETQLDERSLSPAEKDAVEVNVKAMKKNLAGFKARYGKDAKSVMYATSTKQAKKD